MIQSYSFGKIKIDGKIYKKDLIIFQNRVHENWRREKGHFLQLKDLEEIIDSNPEIIIIGRGYFGRMKISEEVIEEFKRRNIIYYSEKSGKAVDIYNELLSKSTDKDIVAAFHLTC